MQWACSSAYYAEEHAHCLNSSTSIQRSEAKREITLSPKLIRCRQNDSNHLKRYQSLGQHHFHEQQPARRSAQYLTSTSPKRPLHGGGRSKTRQVASQTAGRRSVCWEMTNRTFFPSIIVSPLAPSIVLSTMPLCVLVLYKNNATPHSRPALLARGMAASSASASQPLPYPIRACCHPCRPRHPTKQSSSATLQRPSQSFHRECLSRSAFPPRPAKTCRRRYRKRLRRRLQRLTVGATVILASRCQKRPPRGCRGAQSPINTVRHHGRTARPHLNSP